MRAVLLAPALLALACASGPGAPAGAPPAEAPDRPYLVMVSFDGMRHDLIDRTATPNFDRVAERGVRAEGLVPGYPSKTFPNHYSIATGLYPAHHGIVDNAFYDPGMDAVYRLGDTSTVRDGAWYGGEPIWVTAERQGVRSASFYWVGSEAPVRGVHPTYFHYYDSTVPYEARVDSVLRWLSLPVAERPQLVTLYFSQPDGVLHRNGPAAPVVDTVVRELDGILGRLLDGLEDLPIRDSLHLILVSDHGMAAAPRDQVFYLEDAADLDGVRVINNTTQALLYFDGDEQRVWAVYEALRERLPHATVHLRQETPEAWRYRDNDRIGDLVVSAEPGWVIGRRDGRPWEGGGMHGWDPGFRPMHGIFMAMGPAIEPGRVIPAFENVHVYPLLARLLGLEPAETDGRLEVLAPVLRTPGAL